MFIQCIVMHHNQSISHCNRYIWHRNQCIVMTSHTLVPLYFICPDFVSSTTLSLHHHVPYSARVKSIDTLNPGIWQSSVHMFIFIVFYTVLIILLNMSPAQWCKSIQCRQSRAVHVHSLTNCHQIAPSIMHHSISYYMCSL